MRTEWHAAWQPRELGEIPTDRLLAVGLRPTVMRLLLIDLFEQHRGHSLSCEEIYRVLIGKGFDVDLSSTYSNVRRLVSAGVLLRGEPRKKVRVCATYRLSDDGRAESM